MNELKAGVIRTPHNEGISFDGGSSRIAVTEDETEFYLKSEADEVIAALEEAHKREVGQLLMEIAKLKKLVETADKLLKQKGGFTVKDITFNGTKLERMPK